MGLQWRSRAQEWDSQDESSYSDITQSMAEAGLLGLTIPAEYGGKGLSAEEYVVVQEALFRSSQSWIVGEPTFCSSGPGPTLILLAPEETRRKFLPDVVAGRKGCAIALTEPEYGSDLTHIETSAVLDGNDYVINGSKRFISGAPTNELYAVFVRLGGTHGAKGVGAIVVEKEMQGLRLERGARFVGLRGLPHGELHFTDCRVPKENLIMGEGSFSTLMTAFNMERLHNATLSLAFAEAAYDEAAAYCEKRKAFGQDIIQFQATYHTLVDMWLAIEAHRLLTYKAATTAVEGRFPTLMDSTLAKLSGCEMLSEITLKAVLLSGGDGTTMDFPVQRLHRDAVALLVAGGSPPVIKNSIAASLFPDRQFPQGVRSQMSSRSQEKSN
jgi:butyryl-CoA dehydrogenase